MSAPLAGLLGTKSPTQDQWEFAPTIQYAQGGMVTDKAPFDIEDIDWQDSLNFIVREGRPVVDSGYSQFAKDPWLTTHQIVEGRPRRGGEHVALDGTRTSFLITNLMMYILASGPSSSVYWKPVPSSTSTTLNGSASGTSAVLTSATGFAIGNYIGIADNNGYVFLAKISNLVGVNVTLDRSLPGAGTFGSGNVVYKCINGTLAGSDAHQVDWVFHPLKRWVIFTNNVDVVLKYDGTVGAVLGGLAGISLTRARCLGLYNGLLHLGDVTISGTRKPATAYWSDVDPEVYTVGGGSLAGFTNLSDVNDSIVTMKNLLLYNIIYLERSIVRQSLVGNVAKIFDFRTVVGSGSLANAIGTGPVATNAIYAFQDYHLFIAPDGIRIYRGANDTEVVSSPIFRGFFDVNGLIDRSKMDKSFMFYVEGRDELFSMYAESEDTFPRSCIILSMKTGRFFFRRFNHEITFADVRRGVTSIAISDLIGTIAEQGWTLDSGGAAGSLALPVFGRADSNKTYLYDLVTPDEDGLAIVWNVTSKEFRSEGLYRRYDRHIMLFAGTSVLVEYSLDRGTSWLPFGTYSPGSLAMRQDIVPDQFVSDNITYRVSGSGGGSEVYRLSAYSRPESFWNL